MDKMAVTGGAGFIGSNLAESLYRRGCEVVIVDDFSNGKEANLAGWIPSDGRARVVRADVNDTERMRELFQGVDCVFHQAAIPSVPRSIADPRASNRANIDGTLSVLTAARDARVRRVVVASSSSVYGDDPNLPKVESRRGRPLSPYALTKAVCEEYCRLFHELYGLETVALRYFNVFGPRQDPRSAYAAVVPRFATRLLAGEAPTIYGDGEQTRDFTFVANVLEANWVAATHPAAVGEVFNIGCGRQTSLNDLVRAMNRLLAIDVAPRYEPARSGDVRHSVADVSKARTRLGYAPATELDAGLAQVLAWYREHPEASHGLA